MSIIIVAACIVGYIIWISVELQNAPEEPKKSPRDKKNRTDVKGNS